MKSNFHWNMYRLNGEGGKTKIHFHLSFIHVVKTEGKSVTSQKNILEKKMLLNIPENKEKKIL